MSKEISTPEPRSLDGLDDDFLIVLPDFPAYGLPRYSKPHIADLCGRGLFPLPVWMSANRRAWRAGDLRVWRATRPVRQYAPRRTKEPETA